jgi:hypothetical protein
MDWPDGWGKVHQLVLRNSPDDRRPYRLGSQNSPNNPLLAGQIYSYTIQEFISKNKEDHMKSELIRKFDQTWRLFNRIVSEFDETAWLQTGRGQITPAGFSFHILQSAKFYLEDKSSITFASGKAFEPKWNTVKKEDLPSQEDILACSKIFQQKVTDWVNEMDILAKNTSFDWTGEINLGTVLFMLHHMVFHVGELSSLLNESKNGNVEDPYVATVSPSDSK